MEVIVEDMLDDLFWNWLAARRSLACSGIRLLNVDYKVQNTALDCAHQLNKIIP